MEHRRPSLFRSFCITLVLLLSLGLCGCKAQPEADTFFFQYEGYFAAPVSSTLTVAITGFSTKEACAAVFQNAASMSFEGNDAVRIQKFSIEPHESIGAYSACVVRATLAFETAGVTDATALCVQFRDGSEQTYPIGTWTFDVQDAPDHAELLNVWSSPASNRVGNMSRTIMSCWIGPHPSGLSNMDRIKSPMWRTASRYTTALRKGSWRSQVTRRCG